jgi:methionyl aminopeptidase
MAPILKSKDEIALMRRAGQIVAETLAVLRIAVRPGVTTEELDRVAEEEIRRRGAVPTFKGYVVGDKVYKKSICTSINEEIVHGIPGGRKLREGDIISLDCGATYKGLVGDAAVTLGVGEITPQARRLLEATEGALYAGIGAARNGARLGDVGNAIYRHARRLGYSVVREYVGHGIGRRMHEPPQVPNYGEPGKGVPLRKGMALALEPMLNIGTWKTMVMPDDWTVKTADGSLSAHFEHTIAITEGAAEILTLP